MKSMQVLPRLTKDREFELARKWLEQKDVEARNLLVQSNIGLCLSLANKFARHGKTHNDLVQAGVLGMMRAADKFDPDLGVPFGSYAWPWIRAAMTLDVLKEWTLASGGSGCLRSSKFFTLLKRRASILAETGSEDRAVEVIAQEMHRGQEQIRAWFERIDHRDSSFESPSLRNIRHNVCDEDLGTPEDMVVRAEQLALFSTELQRAIDRLTPRQQQVVWAIMDSDEADPCLQTIATEIGLSRERVRQLRNKAFAAIRQHMKWAA